MAAYPGKEAAVFFPQRYNGAADCAADLVRSQRSAKEGLPKVAYHPRCHLEIHEQDGLLDGARLFESLPFYQKSAADICVLFDSVYVSFYKGIGGIAGAILAGDRDFIEEAIVWKRRHGGDLISLYPYIPSADYYFNQRIDRMERQRSK